MSEPEKANGVDEPDVKADPPPNPQRKPRLNRRSFHLKDNPIVNLFSDISDQKKTTVTSLDKAEGKLEEKPFQKKIISLKSPQNSKTKGDGSSTIISLKSSSFSAKTTRNENTVPTEVSSSSDPPPKKKHKPITWP